MANNSTRQLDDLVALIRNLTGEVVRAASVPELLSGAFRRLFDFLPFDVGVTVMLEQNLDLYIATREGGESLIDERLVASIRETLADVIPVSFTHTEVVVKAEWHDLPAAGRVERPRYSTAAILTQEHRIAGLAIVYRTEPELGDEQRQILEIFATQVSMLLDNLRARDQILGLADTDDLTGIWNKRFFRRQLPQEVERARTYDVPLSLLFFDIDDFKQINDGFGHTIGDVVLSELCGAVRETLRPPDCMARFGGDEFAIILPHTDLAGARAVAERILHTVRLLSIPADDESAIRCSVSMGVAQYQPSIDAGPHDLVRRADERLYEAKRGGKNRFAL